MPTTTLAFAETIFVLDVDNPALCHHIARSTAPSVNDLQQFPPLTCNVSPVSVKSASCDDGWEQINDPDEVLSCDSNNSTVGVKHRTYAEIATQAGVEHYPIKLPVCQHIRSARAHASRGESKTSLSQGYIRQRRRLRYTVPSTTTTITQVAYNYPYKQTLPLSGAHDNPQQEQLCQSDPWYQSKCLRKSKYRINPLVSHRKQKTLEIAFRRAAQNYMAMSKKRRRDPKQKLSEAQQYLDTVKSLQMNLPPRYYVQGDRRARMFLWDISRRHDKYYSGRISLDRFEEAFKDPVVREVVLNLIDKRLKSSTGWLPIPEYDKEQWPRMIEYYAHCYQTHIYHDLYSVSREYEYTIIPQLREVYFRAKRKWISDLTYTLPSIKDKSVCRRSRMEYARHVLRDWC